MGPLQLMQRLPRPAHERLPPRLVEIAIGLELLCQLSQQLLLVGRQRPWSIPQAAAQKGLKGLAASLKVAKTTIRFELQPLLQGPQPDLKAQD